MPSYLVTLRLLLSNAQPELYGHRIVAFAAQRTSRQYNQSKPIRGLDGPSRVVTPSAVRSEPEGGSMLDTVICARSGLPSHVVGGVAALVGPVVSADGLADLTDLLVDK